MELALQRVPADDRAELYALVDDYLAELSAHRERAVGPTRAADYGYLPTAACKFLSR